MDLDPCWLLAMLMVLFWLWANCNNDAIEGKLTFWGKKLKVGENEGIGSIMKCEVDWQWGI